jgi:hypothetical protein
MPKYKVTAPWFGGKKRGYIHASPDDPKIVSVDTDKVPSFFERIEEAAPETPKPEPKTQTQPAPSMSEMAKAETAREQREMARLSKQSRPQDSDL